MNALARPLGKQYAALAGVGGDPAQPGRMGEQAAWLPAKYRDGPSASPSGRRVGEAGAVRGKNHRSLLGQAVVGERYRLAGGQEFKVDVAGSFESTLSADKRQHAPVGRKCGSDDRVGEIGELHVFSRAGRGWAC